VKAAWRERYGSPDVVELRDIPLPRSTGDQVLVRVHAASVNRADLDLLYPNPGFTRLFLGLRRPRDGRIGCDVAGVVEAVGPRVTRFRAGDRVFGDLYPFGLGGFGEAACVPERAFQPVPAGMTLEDAATLPHAAILAIQGLRRRDGRTVGSGDRVLIEGASGNVGPFAVQIAKHRGAHVTAVCSTDKVDLVRTLGADEVIDYRTTDYTTTGDRYDWILAVEAHHSILRVRRALRPKGVYVTLGGATARLFGALLAGPVVSLATGRSMGLMLWWKPFRAEDVAALSALYAAGVVRPIIDRRYPLADVVEALRYVDEGRARGKVLVTMDAAEPAPG
jgi:NADPH:quinone reductase-like Zn-dependent oxidoreductase